MSVTSNISAFIYFNIQYNRLVPPAVFFFGVLGNSFNILIFTRSTLRKNACTTYFLGLAVTNLNNLILGLLPNYLIDAHGIDLLTATIGFCRIRFLILHCSLVLSSWFIILAGVDRFCISSRDANRRRFSTRKNARRTVGLAVLICFVVYAHVLRLFTIEETKLGPVCYAQSGTYRVFYDFLFFSTFSFTPPILMIIVGLATLNNILRARGQIHPIVPANTLAAPTNIIQLRKRDRQFVKMLLLQLLFTIALTLPIAVQKLYATLTQNIAKSSSRLEIENFAAQAVRTLTQINSGLSFYLYTLSGSVFRRELGTIVCKMIGLVFGVHSRVYQRSRQIIGPNATRRSMATERTGITKRYVEPIQQY